MQRLYKYVFVKRLAFINYITLSIDCHEFMNWTSFVMKWFHVKKTKKKKKKNFQLIFINRCILKYM